MLCVALATALRSHYGVNRRNGYGDHDFDG